MKASTGKITVLRSMCVSVCRLELMWSQDKTIHKVFNCFVCVCVDGVVRLGVEPWRGCNFLFLAEGVKIEFFGIIR